MNNQAIIYARTACENQIDDKIKITRQIQACSALAKKSGLTIVDTVLHKKVNGMNGSEKRLLNLLKLCKKKKAKILITYDIERLSRNCDDYIRFLFLLETKNIDLLTVISGKNWTEEIWAKYYDAALSRAIKVGIAEAKKRKSLANNL